MLFNSYIFVLAFLPLCIIGYYVLGRFYEGKFANAFLLGMSLWFYGYYNLWYLVLIIGSVFFNYLLYRLILLSQKKRICLVTGLVANIGVLVYFKYMDFFISTINAVFNSNLELLHIILPLGISFFTFQQLSFIIDAFRGDVGTYSILEYACYVTFFPQLVAGPIVTHDELIPQLIDASKKKVNYDNIVKGIYLFSLGMAKKVLLADTFGRAVDAGFLEMSSLNSIDAVVVIVSYTFQIYFDFSGYCDMAIGIGKMFNINLPINFNSPYQACSINEFWDRWHMTLTRFFTRYVYIPLGGNRKGQIRTYVNIFIVFLLSGFWHGAGYTFILWGILHGVLCIIHRAGKSMFDKLPKVINWVITFVCVNLLWVFFRADTVKDAVTVLGKVCNGGINPVSDFIAESFHLWEVDLIFSRIPVIKNVLSFDLICFMVISFVLIWKKKNAIAMSNSMKISVKSAFASVILLVWCIVSFAGVSSFLYFNF